MYFFTKKYTHFYNKKIMCCTYLLERTGWNNGSLNLSILKFTLEWTMGWPSTFLELNCLFSQGSSLIFQWEKEISLWVSTWRSYPPSYFSKILVVCFRVSVRRNLTLITPREERDGFSHLSRNPFESCQDLSATCRPWNGAGTLFFLSYLLEELEREESQCKHHSV